ncbi:MAG: TonB-dependent receptor [Candidatus Omnitrophica bacterium]|nr:TonB-dependent receptor [Candidatus Omnitrophota bacterium]
MKRFIWIGLVFGAIGIGQAAHAADERTVTLEGVTVSAAKQNSQFLPDVQQGKIYAGKKATVTRPDRLPPIANNTHRQTFYQSPGLLVSELPNGGHANFNYRGIGDPHEAQDILILKDGVPISFERFGYATAYYLPPTESVERVELIRGGGALLYGPQPGPVLNYVTDGPPTGTPLTAGTQQEFGSYGTYNTYNAVGGSSGAWGVLADYYHTHSNGQRANEGYDVNGGNFRTVLDKTDDSRWILTVDAHRGEHHEPGRLTLAQFNTNRDQTLRPHDRLEIERYAANLVNERQWSKNTASTVMFYGTSMDRFSLRRTSNTSTQNNLDRRENASGGVEGRVQHHYSAWGDDHLLTLGGTAYYADAPRTQDRSRAGTYPSEQGTAIFEYDYRTAYGALFGENKFNFGKLSIIPGFRLDILSARIKELFNTGKTSPLHNINELYVTPLVGLGAQYDLTGQTQLYGNVSQGYKPPQFDDLAPTGNNTLPADTLEEGKTWSYEAGIRGTPTPWAQFDASAFLTNYDNYFGTVTVGANTQRRNVGRSVYHGVDFSGEINATALLESLMRPQSEPSWADRVGVLSLFGNVVSLSAEFEEGPLNGREPAYAPDLSAKTGLIYRWRDRAKLALIGTFVGDHFWADNNAAGTTGTTGIPAYAIWDVTGEFNVWKNQAGIFFGINNFTDENYFSRVRSDGVEPALRRNYYGGFRVRY